ncbi:3-hydroxyacyl-CoA dehydrogenase family protein [Burkholderia gladioli pv. gladioli]|uniref:3-hydroxyacyl-CoA dehydrogenase, NAD binding domain protein n=1 Tax=Burkholderia gladioli TaxID=28095 RepID=A0A095EZI9_BURGA|nr:3-hydroxyacyl-CoA dehydrogenase family protein [Burkholderia gladioli]AJW98355.1 3-hydroxyacyl-CoA dehydrogenase, NAD binding domain protein [Burkholderia gladioli]ASD79853.1 3-hydroxybutyryl-CoA dehydrogenase [Burkholderia gladioli pv. gladioli]AWY54902.1 3-hydroxybutyryl-CoA dehydrogenase [Burkholderia gladioli pv. gladioli]KGC10836.1 3-hydroxyacyl-CoA dehydrogenase, NAD binding domain protein [Burkholderia gladioli]MDJ1164112.1 3-hydroxyacyl-CoA dehydrogenase family protein [Burkholderia
MLERAAVVGAGTMGAAIAAVFASNGYSVSVYSRSERTLEAARKVVAALAGEHAPVDYTDTLEQCVNGASIVSENVAEDVAIKQQIFGEIEAVVSPDCLLTTNTSSVPISVIAEGLRYPERLVGLHWFNPAAIMPLVEIVRGARTADEVVNRTRAVCVRLGKASIEVNRDIAGFVVNRLQYAMLREALYLVEQGVASIEDVDRAVETTLAPRWSASGPLQLMDLAGLDVVEKVSSMLMPSLSRDMDTSLIVRQLCAERAFGIKSGRGFYQWTTESIATALRRRDETVQMLRDRAASGAQS